MTKDQVIELARGIHLIDSRGACSFVEGTNIVPYLEKFATLVRNSTLEEVAKVCSIKAEVMAVTGKLCDPDKLAKGILNLKEPTGEQE